MQIRGIIQIADKVFAETLFKQDPDLLDVWVNYPPHPLQEQEPLGDRKWIPSFELLQVSTSVTLLSGHVKTSACYGRRRFLAPAWVTGLFHYYIYNPPLIFIYQRCFICMYAIHLTVHCNFSLLLLF
jgi:hypothetical protein